VTYNFLDETKNQVIRNLPVVGVFTSLSVQLVGENTNQKQIFICCMSVI